MSFNFGASDYLLYNYDFFRLATPIKPGKPEPNSILLLPAPSLLIHIENGR